MVSETPVIDVNIDVALKVSAAGEKGVVIISRFPEDLDFVQKLDKL